MNRYIPLHSSLLASFYIHAETCGKVAKRRNGWVRGDVVEAETPREAVQMVLEREGRDDLDGQICPCARAKKPSTEQRSMSPLQLHILEVACNARSINPESLSFEVDREPKDCQAPIARLIQFGWLAGSIWDARITAKGTEAMNAEHRKLQEEAERIRRG